MLYATCCTLNLCMIEKASGDLSRCIKKLLGGTIHLLLKLLSYKHCSNIFLQVSSECGSSLRKK